MPARSTLHGNAKFGGIERREFLVAIALTGASMAAARAALGPESGRPTQADWKSVLEVMFPHDGFDRALYAPPAAALSASAQKDAAAADTLARGWKVLNQAAGGRWRDASPAARARAIALILGTPLFPMLRGTMLMTFYNDPKVWSLCGYEGDAWSRGGYAGPGLLQVDWLPDRTDESAVPRR
jgi:hypothetical protein